MSPKIRLPIVLAESKWITVGSAVKSIWLKFAVLPLPVATVPFNQFAPLLQSPPVTALVHTPLCACKLSAPTASKRAIVVYVLVSLAATGRQSLNRFDIGI